jgi:hypothetical protein
MAVAHPVRSLPAEQLKDSGCRDGLHRICGKREGESTVSVRDEHDERNYLLHHHMDELSE